MKFLGALINAWKLLTNVTKSSILDVAVILDMLLVSVFKAFCPLKGHTYLGKPAAENFRYVNKYVRPFWEHQTSTG